MFDNSSSIVDHILRCCLNSLTPPSYWSPSPTQLESLLEHEGLENCSVERARFCLIAKETAVTIFTVYRTDCVILEMKEIKISDQSANPGLM